jgi:predicted nucleotidyltransferase
MPCTGQRKKVFFMERLFSTYLLDAALQRKRAEREECRKRLLDRALAVLDLLAEKFQFSEAYVFGSLVKEGHYVPGCSDIDIAIRGLRDQDFFPAAAFLSSGLETDVDLIQLESHPLEDNVKQEGVRWIRRSYQS